MARCPAGGRAGAARSLRSSTLSNPRNPNVPMNATESKLVSDQITPAVHLEFIQNHLEASTPSTAEQVEQYHRALFMHHHAPEWEMHRHEVKTRQDKLLFLESQLQDTHRRLSERTRLVPVTIGGTEDVNPTAPWNGWDLSMFVICALGIVGLLIFGIFNVSFNLLESGLITFRENPFRAYLWSALLPLGALAIKIGWDFLDDPRGQKEYVWICLAVGMAGVLAWVAAYACVYPTLSKGINEQIATLTVFEPTAGASQNSQLNFAGTKWVDVITVASQAVAEIFLSAVIGIYLTILYARHRPVRLAYDPAFAQLDRARHGLEDGVAKERAALGQATGKLMRLENELSALLAYSVSIFNREAARRHDHSEKKQMILDQLSEHVRHQLSAMDSVNRVAQTATDAPAGGRNGN